LLPFSREKSLADIVPMPKDYFFQSGDTSFFKMIWLARGQKLMICFL
jgi:hypothetical protein